MDQDNSAGNELTAISDMFDSEILNFDSCFQACKPHRKLTPKKEIGILCLHVNHMGKQISLVMRKPAFCICENKDADQLRGNSEADQRLCFRYMDSTNPLLSKSEISSL